MEAADAFFLAVDFPLNHLFWKMGSVLNTEDATFTVQYWTGTGWADVVHLNDYTQAFKASGVMEFTPDMNAAWCRSNSNSNGSSIPDLSDIVVYNQYWLKITSDIDLTALVELAYIGHVFSEDADLYSEYPIFNDATFRGAYESGKTDWEEQHVKAAELLIQDMIRKNIILGPEQILERSILMPAAVCKTAEIVFGAFGNDYRDEKKDARTEYDKRIDLSIFKTDKNNNAIKEPGENQAKVGWLSR